MYYTLPDMFYDLNIVSVSVRLILAFLIGGIIGMERGSGHHPAGFRTHILVCVGSALVMVTNQFLFDHYYILINNGDVARLGAQVITGVGFLGAGTIMVAGKQRVKGLTTAAGLWASACIGLAVGIGFYSGAIIGAILIFLSIAFLSKIEPYFYGKTHKLDLYLEAENIKAFKKVKRYLKDHGSSSVESSIISLSDTKIIINITTTLPSKENPQEILARIENMDGVYMIEDL
ncbi:MAG: MgtC/SapB family protein [Firmicutes bacterium]|nr:MgtC/SapB family protein [Bacillota bacterium]